MNAVLRALGPTLMNHKHRNRAHQRYGRYKPYHQGGSVADQFTTILPGDLVPTET